VQPFNHCSIIPQSIGLIVVLAEHIRERFVDRAGLIVIELHRPLTHNHIHPRRPPARPTRRRWHTDS
jgi:hypothetical protein